MLYKLVFLSFFIKIKFVFCKCLILFLLILFKIFIVSLGFGKGWRIKKFWLMFNFLFNKCALFLNNFFKGFMSLKFIYLGSLFILWWVLIIFEGFLMFMDLIILGYKVFWVKNLILFFKWCFLVFFLNILIKVLLMIFCFNLGLFMFFNLDKKIFLVFIVFKGICKFLNIVCIFFFLFLCNKL